MTRLLILAGALAFLAALALPPNGGLLLAGFALACVFAGPVVERSRR
jgi:hypothetical protein